MISGISNLDRKWNLSIEYFFVLCLFTGMVIFNKTMTEFGFKDLSIADFLIMAALLVNLALILIHKERWGLLANVFSGKLCIFVLFAAVGLVKLLITPGNLFTEIQNSKLLLYLASFFLLFYFSFNELRLLSFIKFFIVVSSFVNGIKIIIFKYSGLVLNHYESQRVFHNETDVICAALSLLALIALQRQLKFNRIVTFVVIALNICILILAVKRTCFIGIGLALLILYSLTKEPDIKKLLRYLSLDCLILVLFWNALLLIPGFKQVHQINDFILYKLSSNELNASWRLQAWHIAWEKYSGHQLTGINLNELIIDQPINNVSAADPHNSFLAFLTRYGLVGFGLLLALIVQSVILAVKQFINAEDNDQKQLILFLIMGLLFMSVFAFFNVVFESSFQGIFFAFFLAGPFFIKNPPVFSDVQKTKRAFIIKFVGCSIAALYIFSVFSPSNFKPIIPVYAQDQNLLKPILYWNNKTPILSESEQGIQLRTVPQSYTELRWLIPEAAKNLLQSSIRNYRLVVELEASRGNCRELYLQNQLGGRYLIFNNFSSLSRRITVTLPDYASQKNSWQNMHSLVFVIKDNSKTAFKKIYFIHRSLVPAQI